MCFYLEWLVARVALCPVCIHASMDACPRLFFLLYCLVSTRHVCAYACVRVSAGAEHQVARAALLLPHHYEQGVERMLELQCYLCVRGLTCPATLVTCTQAENKFKCPCHGSQYDAAGKVVRGPAPLSLALAHADVDESGLILFSPW